MALIQLPLLAGWMCAATGVIFAVLAMRGIDAPRVWLEWIERRFAYAMRMRFVGGGLLLLAGTAIFFLPADGTFIAKLALGGLTALCIVAFGLLGAQNLARHLVIAVAEQNDLVVRIIAGVITLCGIALATLPFVP